LAIKRGVVHLAGVWVQPIPGEKEEMRWTIKGFPASPGVTVGLAVVITSHILIKYL